MVRKALFVCTANICRGPMAEAIFNALAEDRGLAYCAESADRGQGWVIASSATSSCLPQLLITSHYGLACRKARQPGLAVRSVCFSLLTRVASLLCYADLEDKTHISGRGL